ncbi:neural cell adhesion molecule 1-B isoform X3 [Bactrocera neohumeralis]|uniref:neural cell adhesion molecule 1-B isoform X3 n=1 Tax=Bactrocera neohumeralis TaxID=98809 RepID=UPI0021658385|nr:neural cell adhesion molecule 1-B isoform X3 [Bactrocera neohumeralis]
MIMLTMWKIFIAFTLVTLRATFVAARLHSSNSLMLHAAGIGGGSGGIGGLTGGSLTNKDAHVKTKDIDAVEGKSVSLPCPISAPLSDVYMVLWFRDNAGIPLYSFDVRDKVNNDQPRHWSAPEVFGSRAKFHFDSQPATLEIKDIKRHDQGVYRCRIDFRTSQTQSFRFNLTVIILPEQPIILDRWGRQLNGTLLGPKQEGDDIVITCRVVGGRPQPQVRWLVNGLLVDNQYEHNSGDVIENRLLWPSVQRTDLNSVFTCQALNTQLDKPKEKSFLLDMHLKPLTVKIIEPPNSMVADRRYEVICESTGSRPNAIITWYKGKRQLRRTKDDISKNVTRSELSFVPTTDDDGKSITCRAENPNVNGLYLETMWKLNVVYPPLVTLRLGSTLTPDDIKEGDDVYFECHVQSNPQWRKLLWLHNNIHLEHNTSARVIRSNQSLVLQKITKHYAGNYACSAINDEGETVSNQLPLRVKYTPVCKHLDRVILIGASKDETVEVTCEIQADPPPRTFRWKFNNSGETLDVGSERFSVNDSRSVLKYTPISDQDYGTLSCWASNEVGTQNQPCLFQVVLAALPNGVSNCSIVNRTDVSVDIQCIPGYDGGLPQIFVLEMFSARTGLTRFNLTNVEEPQFSLENLDTLTSMMTQENNSLKLRIYAYNQKGRSPLYLLSDFIIGSSAYKSDEVSITLSPVLVGSGLTVVIISLAIIVRIFIVTFLHNLRRNQQHSNKPIATGVAAQAGDVLKCGGMEKPRWQHTDIKTKSSEDLVEDERDPDVIPSQYVTAGNSNGVGGGGGSSGGSGNGSSNSGGGGGSSGSGNAGSSELHFTPIAATKWSPNSKQHLPATAYDNITQLVAANQITARTTHLLSGPTTDPNGSSSSVIVNAVDTGLLHHHQQQQQQQQLLNAKAAGAGVGAGAGASAATVVTATHSANGLNEALIGSPTAAYNATHQQQQQQQQQLHGAGSGSGGTLPPGLGSGSAYILNSLINSNESCNSNGSISGSNGGLHHNVVGGTIGRATMLHHHQQQQQQSHHPLPVPHPLAYNTLAGTTGVSASGRHHHSALPSMLLTSQTSASLSGIGLLLNASNNNSSSSGGASGLGLSMTGAATASAASTATTSCNSSSDLDDNININAIKDCLMTQRVPESCV